MTFLYDGGAADVVGIYYAGALVVLVESNESLASFGPGDFEVF
ncbi:hypothetical protein [Ponticoccus litoralis]|uniref:Uncharacterized protein n=1 Tax=Ponticoccus litoralis TaxID=422297 RepID=A0AAW9SUH5_9RHOB